MLKNYLKVGLRNFFKHRTYSAINLGGLGIAVAVCLLIGLFVRQERTFDRFHAKADRICRPWVYEKDASEEFMSLQTPHPLEPTLKATCPEVEAATHYMPVNNMAKKGPRVFTEPMHLSDPDYLRTFSFPRALTASWHNIEPGAYVLLREGTDAARLEARFPGMVRTVLGGKYKRLQLLNQCWGQAVLMTRMAVGVVAASLLLRAFNGLLGGRHPHLPGTAGGPVHSLRSE